MSKFIDKLIQLSQAPQPMGFRAAPTASLKPRIQLVASSAYENIDHLAGYFAGADAGLLRIAKPNLAVKGLQKAARAMSDISWGCWLESASPEEVKQLNQIGSDFIVFAAADTPLTIPESADTGKILAVELSLGEGLLRAINVLPIDAILLASEPKEDYLTWQHLILFQRFADLLTKPLLVSVPARITAGELQALWQAGVDGIVVEVEKERVKGLRQLIDGLTFPIPRKRQRMEPLLPRISPEPGVTAEEEEPEEEPGT